MSTNHPGSSEFVSKSPRSPRVEHGVSVLFKAQHKTNYRGVVLNLSKTGVLLSTRCKLIEGTELILYLPLEHQKRRSLCLLPGKVVRIEPEPEKTNHQSYGIMFHPEMIGSARKLLEDYVVHQRQDV